MSFTRAIEVVKNLPSDGGVIVGGDYNTTADDPDFSPFSSLLSYTGPPNPDPCVVAPFGKSIDHIFFRGPYQVQSVSRLCTDPHPSDHPSVVAEFEDTRPEPPQIKVAVPDVREMMKDAAVNEIHTAGLEPQYTGSTAPGAWVWNQSPHAGAIVDSGSTVTLQLRTGPIP
jgi:hypothetical protein